MSFATMATLALGGAAIGALANPEDRKKGALMGLGAGILAPLAAPALAGGTLAAGAGTAGAGGAITAAGAGSAGTAGAGILGVPGLAGSSGAALVPGVSGAAPGILGVAGVPGTAGLGAAAAPTTGILGVQGVAGTGSTALTNTALTAAPKAGLFKTALTKAGELATSEGAKDLAIGLAPQALASANKPGPEAPAPRSLAMQTQQGGGDSLYQRAAMNQQARMQKRQKGPKRFI
jgi:hypothetical protein